jgi:hypothetical protein
MAYASTPQAGLPNGGPSAAGLVELQGALGFLHDQAASAVRRLYDYIERHSPDHPGLAGCLAAAIEASHAFEEADYGRALDEVRRAYQEVALARAADPSLPPLSGLGSAAARSG